MSGFIKRLEGFNAKDTKVRAVLRRSLSHDPGAYVPAYPYVEPHIKNEENQSRREAYYLVAGLWAMHMGDGPLGAPMSIGSACAAYHTASGSTSIEARFITLLDADRDQLPHRLRQMVALLKEYAIDFDDLLNGLLYWDNDHRRTQHKWARDFYRNINDTEPATKETS